MRKAIDGISEDGRWWEKKRSIASHVFRYQMEVTRIPKPSAYSAALLSVKCTAA